MDTTTHHGSRASATTFCLGHPSHALQPGEQVCPLCGALAVGTQIGMYHVQKLLGVGRSGRAYLAVHQRSQQPVAVKLIAPSPGPFRTPQGEQWELARREVRSVTALQHPAILPVFSCSTWQAQAQAGTSTPSSEIFAVNDKTTYLLALCQYVPGTLPYFVAHYQKPETQRTLRERNISVLSILMQLLQQAGSALSTAHARGIVHGAIVPGNVLLASYERLWIADFGLAKLQPPPVPFLPPELYGVSNAPERVSAYWQAVTPASDQYMFAVLCQQLFKQIMQPIEYEHLLPVLQRATQQRPERRYSNIELFMNDLLSLAGHKITTQPLSASRTSSSAHLAGVSASSSARASWQSAGMPNIAAPVTPALPLTHASGSDLRTTAPTPAQNPVSPVTPLPIGTSSSPTTSGIQLTADDWEKRADKLFTMRNYEEALVAYHHALEMSWGKATLWIALGDTYFALTRHKEALMAYEQAMYLNPNDPQAWANRGTVLDVLGRHREAVDCYERSEQLGKAKA